MSKLENLERAEAERALEVYKRNDMIQKARFSLSIQEQRAVLYAISKIKPDDTCLDFYEFEIKDFYRVIGWSKQSYTEFKALMLDLRNKGWYIPLQNGEETSIAWFSKVNLNKRSGKVKIKFDEDMVPYLVRLAQGTEFYTKYQLQYVLPMSSIYGPRLYEILKSYQFNNIRWFFEVDELKRLLDCQNYVRWPDFRRYALEPAIAEINKYTDLKIAYKPEKTGKKTTRIIFGMLEKTGRELQDAQKAVREALDGQMSIEDVLDDLQEDPLYRFEKEHAAAVVAEQQRKAEQQAKLEASRKSLIDFYGK